MQSKTLLVRAHLGYPRKNPLAVGEKEKIKKFFKKGLQNGNKCGILCYGSIDESVGVGFQRRPALNFWKREKCYTIIKIRNGADHEEKRRKRCGYGEAVG